MFQATLLSFPEAECMQLIRNKKFIEAIIALETILRISSKVFQRLVFHFCCFNCVIFVLSLSMYFITIVTQVITACIFTFL